MYPSKDFTPARYDMNLKKSMSPSKRALEMALREKTVTNIPFPSRSNSFREKEIARLHNE
jgi:hypothetical protein